MGEHTWEVKDAAGRWIRLEPEELTAHLSGEHQREETRCIFKREDGNLNLEFDLSKEPWTMTDRNTGDVKEIRHNVAPKQSGQWLVQLDSGWTRVEPVSLEAELTEAYHANNKGVKRFKSTRGSVEFEYEVNFSTWKQKNLSNGTERNVTFTEVMSPEFEHRISEPTAYLQVRPKLWEVDLGSEWASVGPPELQAEVNAAYDQNREKHVFEQRRGQVDFKYEIVFKDMIQRNLSNGTVRSIRCREDPATASASPTPTASYSALQSQPGVLPPSNLSQWEIQLDTGWAPLQPESEQTNLTRALEDGKTRYRFSAKRGQIEFTYEVDFQNMVQQNISNDTVRKVRFTGQRKTEMKVLPLVGTSFYTLFISCQLTVRATAEIEQWVSEDRPVSIKASMPKFNVNRGAKAWNLTNMIAFDVPCFGPLITRAILDIFALPEVKMCALSRGARVPQYTLNTVVQERVSRAKSIVAEAKQSQCSEAAIDKLSTWIDTIQRLKPGEFTAADDWMEFVGKHVCAGWETRLRYGQLLENFGFSEIESKALSEKPNLNDGLRWLSKSFDCFGFPGSLADVVNLVFAMMGQTPGKPDPETTEAVIKDFTSRLHNQEWHRLWLPTHMVHDAEVDDLAAWLICSTAQMQKGGILNVLVQLPADPAFANIHDNILRTHQPNQSPVKVFKDDGSKNGRNVHEAVKLLMAQ